MNEITPKVVLVAPLFGYEGGSENLGILISLAQGKGYQGPYTVASKPKELAAVPPHSVVLTDNPARLGRSLHEIISLFAKLIAQDCTILIPDTIEIAPRSREAHAILALVQIRKRIRSTNIKEGIWYAKSRGQMIGRNPVPDAVKRRILEEHNKGLSLDKIFRTLQKEGIEVSRSSIHLVISEWRARYG